MDIELNINSRVEILKDDMAFKSIIQDTNEENLSISLPVRDGVYITPQVGEQLEVIYYDNTHVYKFTATVITRKKEQNVPVLILDRPKNIIKIQRRKFVRINIRYSIKYSKLINKIDRKKLEQIKEDDLNLSGVLVDLSGGGFRLKTADELSLNEFILGNMSIEGENIKIFGEVVRKEKAEDKQFYYGISFIEMDDKTRDKIIQNIFKIMRKQLKN
ncbi:PilZ domain-containing protein [Clostridium sp. 19966]|uniref:flagellar brake protein n=1 Tax=Clostridium sp. 19966 TaxID=2768166 RepID=UPI0028DED74C|nr:flagellar brake domain-containing protein [Clostridium sp. 19966]MDT8716639.1 PilZ domain-containing protein [Clostridium sp. 19966]